MSSALVRQSLEFVDPDASRRKKKQPKQRGAKGRPTGQDSKPKLESPKGVIKQKKEEKVSEELIKKLLELSKPTVDKTITDKIVQRAVKGKPLIEIPKVKKVKQKSILFPEDNK